MAKRKTTGRSSGRSGSAGSGRSGDHGGSSSDGGKRPIQDDLLETGDGVDLLEIGPEDAEDILEFDGATGQKATIKVVGVGGGGGNALNTMIRSGLSGVEFVAANTDSQALKHNLAPLKVQLGAEVTRGLGCGANPDRGRASALEVRDRLREILEGSDMVFVTAGMGGGTGTGSAPIIAEVAREIGALTVGVVTKPFPFEGRVRSKHAERGLDDLHNVVDTLITIPNQRLLSLAGKTTNMKDAFGLADAVLMNAVRGISDLITIHGLINLDFADVRTVMNEAGVALMGTGIGQGDTRAVDAAESAISSPLLEDLRIDGARGVLINITGNSDMTLFEVNEASMLVQEAAHEDANIIFGAVIDDDMPDGELRVTVIATGLDDGREKRTPPSPDRRVDQRPDFGSEPLETEHAAHAQHADAAPALEPVTSMNQVAPTPQAMAQPPAQHAEPAPMPSAPPAQQAAQPPAAPSGTDEARARSVEEAAQAGLDFASPFEDEYDTPAFIRRRNNESDDEDREVPAFLRRAQD